MCVSNATAFAWLASPQRCLRRLHLFCSSYEWCRCLLTLTHEGVSFEFLCDCRGAITNGGVFGVGWPPCCALQEAAAHWACKYHGRHCDTARAIRKAAARVAPAVVIPLGKLLQDGDADMKGRCAHIARSKFVERYTSSSSKPNSLLMNRCYSALVMMLEAAVVVEDVSLHGSLGVGSKLLAALSPAAGTLRALDFTLKSVVKVPKANSPATELLRLPDLIAVSHVLLPATHVHCIAVAYMFAFFLCS